ncbi:MAG: FAD-dependent oxidoreductase [Proteobacteria bacterium]|nr:FAD-dependent oxidoreductase [Pseudomonadota bacterium]
MPSKAESITPYKESKEKIVIVGAGLAGLTTAYRLLQKQYDIEVYEARPRVGGRVHTILMKNLDESYSLAELGAQNLTDGGSATYIFTLIKEMDLEVINSYSSLDGQFYDGEHFYRKSDILKKLNATSSLMDKIEEAAKTSHSMQDVLDRVFKENTLAIRMFSFMLNGYEGLPPHLLSAQPHNVETLKHMISGGLSQAHQSQQIHKMTLKGGNGLLPLKLAEKIGGRLHLNKALKKVTLQKNHKIELTFSDNTTTLCDKLILAIPASVYNDIYFDKTLIDPEKLKLIQSIHYGTNGKILIPIKSSNISETFFFTDWVGTFFNQDHKILNCYFVHDNGKNLLLNSEYIKTLSFLKKIYPTASFKETSQQEINDVQFAKTNNPVIKSWVKDLYAKGSYSSYGVVLQELFDQKINYQNIIVKKVFEPIDDRIFFVGEHTTIIDEIGTMEAAVESGERISQIFN